LPRDYKSGWELQEWEEPEKARKRNLAFGVDDVDDWGVDPGDEVSLCKFHCRQPFVDLVVTKCKHYFYEYCALKVILCISTNKLWCIISLKFVTIQKIRTYHELCVFFRFL
jgi:hypothetical protein